LEIVLRLTGGNYLKGITDERNTLYVFHKTLGWFSVPNAAQQFTGSITINIKNNSLGFRDEEHSIEKTKSRVAVLGDSFVWGYDVEANERFTNLIKNYEVLNWGVSGYSTDQEYLLYKELAPIYKPDITVVVYHTDDKRSNSIKTIFGGYSKPTLDKDLNITKPVLGPKITYGNNWFVQHTYIGKLLLRVFIGFLKDDKNPYNPTIDIIRGFAKLAGSYNSKFILILTGESPELNDICMELKCIDARMPKDKYFLSYGQHWTKEGHEIIAKKLEDEIMRLENKK